MKRVAQRVAAGLLILMLCGFFPSLARSLGPTEAPYLGLAGSYAFTDEDGRPTPVDDGGGVQLLFGWPASGRWTFELHLAHHELDAEVSGVDAKRTALALDGVFFFNPQGPTAYLLAGLGAVRNDLDPVDEDTDVFANAGIGVMSGPLNRYSLRLRGDVRYVADNYHNNPDDVHVPRSGERPAMEGRAGLQAEHGRRSAEEGEGSGIRAAPPLPARSLPPNAFVGGADLSRKGRGNSRTSALPEPRRVAVEVSQFFRR